MKPPLAVGDRVRCYDRGSPWDGTLREMDASLPECWRVELKEAIQDYSGKFRAVHPKAMRRLIFRKPRREVWVHFNSDGEAVSVSEIKPSTILSAIARGSTWVHFVEARGKRK